MKPLPQRHEMERAFLAGDASYDGVFFTGVRTTGIFCRPSCPARKPRPENVAFFASARDALFAGFRACKRCEPLLADGRVPDWVRRLLDAADESTDRRLGDGDVRSLGVDPARARRYFLKHYGMTFQAYCRGRRLGGALEQLRRGAELDEVALGNGYESQSGFRDAFSKTFGQPPGKSRTAECIQATWIETPLGPMVAGATSGAVCLLEFTDRRMLETQFAVLARRFGCAVVPGQNPLLDQLKQELSEYFTGARREFTQPLLTPGTPFEARVWAELLRIPYSVTRSYEDIAVALGNPGAQRAVGAANGRNRIAILIPCHRVVNKGGRLGGYGGGVWRKEALLHLERTGERLLDFGDGGRHAPPEKASA